MELHYIIVLYYIIIYDIIYLSIKLDYWVHLGFTAPYWLPTSILNATAYILPQYITQVHSLLLSCTVLLHFCVFILYVMYAVL